jgi:site-specific DNA recombinase
MLAQSTESSGGRVRINDRPPRTKSRLLATGATRGGIHFGRGSLFYLLRNRFYIGEVEYKDEILPGEQPSTMNRGLFDAVQQKLTDQWTTRSTTRNASDYKDAPADRVS